MMLRRPDENPDIVESTFKRALELNPNKLLQQKLDGEPGTDGNRRTASDDRTIARSNAFLYLETCGRFACTACAPLVTSCSGQIASSLLTFSRRAFGTPQQVRSSLLFAHFSRP
jgi:hypothetical protein